MLIRPVSLADAEAIADIYNHYILATDISFETSPLTPEAMRERIASLTATGPYIVGEREGSVVGYAYAHPWKERAAYARTLETTVYLRRGAYGQGQGRRLMEALIDRCRQMGVHVLVACITADNEASLRFHQALGFEQVSHFHEVGYKHDRWLDVIDMQLTL